MTKVSVLLEPQQPQVTNLSRVKVDQVRAELVRMHQSTAQAVQSEVIDLNQCGVLGVEAESLSATTSVLALVQAEEASLHNSGAGIVRASNISMSGIAGAVVADNVELSNSYVGMLAGREVRGTKIESIILLSHRVEGDVTTVMDTRGALIAGLVGGLFCGMIFLLGRTLLGRKQV